MPETFPDPGSSYKSSAGELQVPLPVPAGAVPAVAVPGPAVPDVLAGPLRLRTGLGIWLRDLIISLAISAFIIIFLYQPVKVEGTSMMPSLEDQERIFVNKFVYRLEPIERGDVVVFRYPRDPSKSYIKRVIGMQGDDIHIDGSQSSVHGQALEAGLVHTY